MWFAWLFTYIDWIGINGTTQKKYNHLVLNLTINLGSLLSIAFTNQYLQPHFLSLFNCMARMKLRYNFSTHWFSGFRKLNAFQKEMFQFWRYRLPLLYALLTSLNWKFVFLSPMNLHCLFYLLWYIFSVMFVLVTKRSFEKSQY